MQGIKELVPKLIYQVQIDKLVPQDNFYRLINKELDLSFLYKLTEQYYGYEGQESIDPVVFFKICLVGYLNNINSDRKLIDYCSDSLAIRLFLKYDIDEPLPYQPYASTLWRRSVFVIVSQSAWFMCVERNG